MPAAYVSISLEQLKSLPIQNQLRILCAGIWHNIVLSIIAALIFFSSTWLWSPLFYTNSGVYVKSINHVSKNLSSTINSVDIKQLFYNIYSLILFIIK